MMKSTQAQVETIDVGATSQLREFDSRVNKVEVDEKSFQTAAWKEIVKQNKTTSQNLRTIWSTVDEHEHELIRLSNGTSNADVLDKLEETKLNVFHQLTFTQANVDKKLVDAQHNVSLMLDSKVHEMQHVVSKATNNINEMEKNITSRLNSISSKLTATVDEVSHSVADAQETISVEVESVRENIRQYVAVTNQQFAAENDFVKYELAGNILEL
jgi:ferritin-like protein